MAETDKVVLELIKIAKTKKEEIQKAEKPNWKTNCSFKFNPDVAANHNIQVVSDVNMLVGILGFLYTQEASFNKAATDLNADATFSWGGYPVSDWRDDIKTRITKINIKKKKDELEIIEARLEKLVSPELRTQLELEELTNMLNK